MKRIFFNIIFTVTFLLTFSTIVYVYSDSLMNALTSNEATFPKDESLNINKCQRWTQQVRNFKVLNGEEANRITVLMYHKIINDHDIKKIHYEDEHKHSLYSTIVLTSEFEKQMKLLQEHHYTTLTAAEFKLFMENKIKIPTNTILITFDDGYKNNYYEAYPILKKYNFTAINFLITSHITEKNSEYNGSENQYFSLSDIQNSCDVFDFQSHTYNAHEIMEDPTASFVGKEKKYIQEDIQNSIENLNKNQPLFSYPNGKYNSSIIQVLKNLDIEMAFTVDYADVIPGMDLYKIPRKAILPSDSIKDFKEKINLK